MLRNELQDAQGVMEQERLLPQVNAAAGALSRTLDAEPPTDTTDQ